MGTALPPGSAGVVAIYDRSQAGTVDTALASAVKKSVAQIDGGGAKKLKAALAEAQGGHYDLVCISATSRKKSRGRIPLHLHLPVHLNGVHLVFLPGAPVLVLAPGGDLGRCYWLRLVG